MSSANHGDNVFCGFERTGFIQIANIAFCNIRFCTSDCNLRPMGRFRIQLLLEDNTWSTRYSLPKHERYSNLSTDWTLVCLNFTEENYAIKLIYNEIDSAHADMCFSNNTILYTKWII